MSCRCLGARALPPAPLTVSPGHEAHVAETTLDPFDLPPQELAALSEEQALRQRLDVRNRRVLPGLLWGAFVFFFVAFANSFEEQHGKGWPLALAGVLVTIGTLVALRILLPIGRAARRPRTLRARALAERFGQVLQGVLLLEYLLAVGWTTAIGATPGFLFAIAPLLLLFRLVAGEALLLHGLTVAAGGLLWFLTQPKGALPALLGAIPLHAVCVALGLLLTRRFRSRFCEQWQQQVGVVREQLRVREELALAREVQLSMLPAEVPALPWLDVAASCLPAYEVGGDYYDFFPDEEGLAVVVADVAGHGVASGLVLASVRSGLALLMEEPDHELGPTMERLDRLVRRTSRRMLVTLALARYDRREGSLTVATAGHPPLLVRRDGRPVEEVATPAPPLGTRLPASVTATRVAFSPGDACLLYTDGLVEAPNEHGEAYGAARLAAMLAAPSSGDSARALCDAVLADVAAHRGTAPQQDDVTLVALVAR